MDGPDWLDGCSSVAFGADSRKVYSLDKMRERFEMRELPDGWLALMHDDDGGLWLHFAALRFAQSDVGGANELDEIVFHGGGPKGNLSECRHTYWGKDGYIFYPNGALITAAFRVLSEFYDDMVEK